MDSEIVGLDFDDTPQFIYIKHKSSELLHKIPLETATKLSKLIKTIIETDSTIIDDEKHPIVIENETERAFNMAISYIMFYVEKSETDPPSKPLPDDDIKNSYGEDAIIFSDFFTKNYDEYDIDYLFEVCNLANYMEMEIFLQKCCAIVGYLLIKNPQKVKDHYTLE